MQSRPLQSSLLPQRSPALQRRHAGSAAEKGRNGYARVRDRFTLERMAECVEAVYGEAAGQPVVGKGHVPYPKYAVKADGAWHGSLLSL